MRLGIDFGTTRTIVSTVDRGNYPIVNFLDSRGDSHDHFPSVVARRGDRLVHGFEALDGDAPVLRSVKRLLADAGAHADTPVEVNGRPVPLLDLLTSFLVALREAMVASSTLTGVLSADEPLEAVVAVPAHAHSGQRFLTLEAFRRAGFDVIALLNEPSAAGFEYTHRQSRTVNSRRTRVIVYDLGGGTFDASLVRVDDRSHEVVESLGINRLGGDDFDEALAGCALRASGGRALPDARAWQALLDECRAAKENLAPQTRRIAVDVDGDPAVVAVEDFYDAAAPLVDATMDALSPLVGGLDAGLLEAAEVAGIYLVGGASGLPLVARTLRERFGRRVHRSPYPAASTAIGLAIAADDTAGYSLTDRLSRGFGVFRESDAGRSLRFDPILGRDQRISADGEVVVTRRYRAAHNVGWYRFVEYTQVGPSGEPTGDVTPLGEIVFPFDEALREGRGLAGVPVERRESGPLVEERYLVDPHGIIQVDISDLDTGYTRRHSLAPRG